MNRADRAKLLAKSLRDSARKAEQELANKKEIERLTAIALAKLNHVHASDGDLICPACGYRGSESDFEPDTDSSSDDGYSTDPETSETGGDDNVEELDAKGKHRVVRELLARHKRRR